MHQLSTSDKSSEKRSRSLSPGDAPVQPNEAVRALRTFIREKENELEQLQRKLKASEKHAADFVSKFEVNLKVFKISICGCLECGRSSSTSGKILGRC
jgi:hypothetical protein